MAPESCRRISIATGSSVGSPLCLSPLCLSIRGCPLGEQVEASPKVGHEKMELTDMTSPLWEGQKFSCRFSEMSARCIVLPALMMESPTLSLLFCVNELEFISFTTQLMCHLKDGQASDPLHKLTKEEGGQCH